MSARHITRTGCEPHAHGYYDNAKASLLKIGGLQAYRRAIPFFLGLICGEFCVGMVGTFLGFLGVYIPQSAGLGGL